LLHFQLNTGTGAVVCWALRSEHTNALPPTCINIFISGPEETISHRLRVTIELFDMLSDNSEVDHPLCEECTDTLLESMEQQLELAESDAQAQSCGAGAAATFFSFLYRYCQNIRLFEDKTILIHK
jgi:hypothetical protein